MTDNLRRIGAQMATMMFNLSQGANLPAQTRETMREMQREWDDAVRQPPARQSHVVGIADLMKDGLLICVAEPGRPFVKINFPTLKQAQDLHQALAALGSETPERQARGDAERSAKYLEAMADKIIEGEKAYKVEAFAVMRKAAKFIRALASEGPADA